MNWVYILLRTFPFWGIPIALALVLTGVRAGKKLWMLVGVVIFAGAVAFLVLQGHFKAVPLAHELLFERTPASQDD